MQDIILGGKEGVPQRAMKNINRRMGRRMVVCATSPKQEVWIARYRGMLEEGHTESTEKYSHTDFSDSTDFTCAARGSQTVLELCSLATEGTQESTENTESREKEQSVRLFMALGATVDFEAGTVKRCPVWIQRLGMEWFWRFCQEPRRLFKWYWVNDMKFFSYFGKQLAGCYQVSCQF